MEEPKAVVHPLWVRVAHWANVLAVLIMVGSGWRIYNASPLFNFRFDEAFTLGGWLAGALLWHFAAMWLLVVNGALYLLANLFSGRLRNKFLPVSFKQLAGEFGSALRLRLAHADLSVYNQLQRAAYIAVWLDIVLLVCSGLVLWKSVQFGLLRELLGGYESARLIHFAAMVVLVVFLAVHVLMVMLVPRTLVAMLRGR